MNSIVSSSYRLPFPQGVKPARVAQTAPDLSTPAMENNIQTEGKALLPSGLLPALYFGNVRKEFRFNLPIEPVIQKLEKSLESVPEYESADVRQVLTIARKTLQGMSNEDLAMEQFINHLKHSQTYTAREHNEDGEVIEVEKPNRLAQALLTELNAMNAAKPPIPLSMKIERGMEVLAEAADKNFSLTAPPLEQFILREQFSTLINQLQGLGRQGRKGNKEHHIFYFYLWNPLVALSKDETPSLPGFKRSDSASAGVAAETLTLLATEQDAYLSKQLNEFHQEYLKKPNPQSLGEVQHLLVDLIGHMAGTEEALKAVLNVMKTTTSDDVKRACVKSLVKLEERKFPGLSDALAEMREPWEKLLTHPPANIKEIKDPAPKDFKEGAFYRNTVMHPYHRAQHSPLTLRLLKNKLENPLLLAVFAYGERQDFSAIAVALKGLLNTGGLNTRMQAATALSAEVKFALNNEEIAIIQKDVNALWEDYLSGDRQVGEKTTGEDMFAISKRFTNMLGYNTIYNKMGQIAFDYSTPESDRLKAMQFIAEGLTQRTYGEPVDEKRLSAFNKVKMKVLKSPDEGVFRGAIEAAYDVASHFTAGEIFRAVPTRQMLMPEEVAKKIGPHVTDLAPFRDRLAANIVQMEVEEAETPSYQTGFTPLKKLKAVFAALPPATPKA